MDREVKDYFFALPPDRLASVFEAYGRKYGAEKRAYAEATFPKWKSGAVHMSGLVAERLFNFLPPVMPINIKLRIVEGLFENSGAARSDYVLAPKDVAASAVIDFVGENLFREMEAQQIARELKAQFGWLAGEDAAVAEQLLQHSLKLTVESKKRAAATILEQMDRDRAANSDVVRDVVSTIRVRKHEVHIKRTDAVDSIKAVGRSTFDRGGLLAPREASGGLRWVVWLLIGVGVVWFLYNA